ncbi:8412_t:CDS:2 [Acaulospora morrowiae]|uniref:8412_t:CDS:1 n=1 Tax=Acaulospora morrowiae TaxID=94023 RepID=A0A9N9N7A5_9GLOM|nr:8412_t:CDS:2 [Acaulospora morrowiae]
MAADQTTPYAVYYFFRSFRRSLPDENDFEDFISTLTVTPLHAVIENVLPFFRRSSDPGLFTKFQVMMRQCEQNPAFESTLMRVCDALDMLRRVEQALRGDRRLMDGYLRAMQFDNDSASHQQVWSGLQRFLNEDCDPHTKRRMEKVFAEQKASDELGLNDDFLEMAYSLIGDDALYIEILETLQLNNRQNLPWDIVINRIQRLTTEKKPQVWPMLNRFLDDVHNGRGLNKNLLLCHFVHPIYDEFTYSVCWEEYLDDETVEPENGVNILEQKFSGISLDTGNEDIQPKPQQEQRKQAREVIGTV